MHAFLSLGLQTCGGYSVAVPESTQLSRNRQHLFRDDESQTSWESNERPAACESEWCRARGTPFNIPTYVLRVQQSIRGHAFQPSCVQQLGGAVRPEVNKLAATVE